MGFARNYIYIYEVMFFRNYFYSYMYMYFGAKFTFSHLTEQRKFRLSGLGKIEYGNASVI